MIFDNNSFNNFYGNLDFIIFILWYFKLFYDDLCYFILNYNILF